MNFKKYVLLTSCLVSLNAANAGGFEALLEEMKTKASTRGYSIGEEVYDYDLPQSQSSLRDDYTKKLGHGPKNAKLFVSKGNEHLYDLQLSHWEMPTNGEASLTHVPFTKIWSISPTNNEIIKPETTDKPVNIGLKRYQEVDYLDALRETIRPFVSAGPTFCAPEFPETMNPFMQVLGTPMMRGSTGLALVGPHGEESPLNLSSLIHPIDGEIPQPKNNFSMVKEVLSVSGDVLELKYDFSPSNTQFSDKENAARSVFSKEFGYGAQDYTLSAVGADKLLYTLRFSYWEPSKESMETSKISHTPMAVLWSVTPPVNGLSASLIQKELIAEEMQKASYLSSLKMFRKVIGKQGINSAFFSECSAEAQPYLVGLGMDMLKEDKVYEFISRENIPQTFRIEDIARVQMVERPSPSSSAATNLEPSPEEMARLREEIQRKEAEVQQLVATPAPEPQPAPVPTPEGTPVVQ